MWAGLCGKKARKFEQFKYFMNSYINWNLKSIIFLKKYLTFNC